MHDQLRDFDPGSLFRRRQRKHNIAGRQLRGLRIGRFYGTSAPASWRSRTDDRYDQVLASVDLVNRRATEGTPGDPVFPHNLTRLLVIGTNLIIPADQEDQAR